MSCKNNVNNCSHNKVESNKYFEYLNTVLVSTDRPMKGFEYVCGSNKDNTEVVECCDNSNTTLTNNYIKVSDTGYQLCKCENEMCKKIYCKDFMPATQYQVCKSKGKNVEGIKTINTMVSETANDNLLDDCLGNCV